MKSGECHWEKGGMSRAHWESYLSTCVSTRILRYTRHTRHTRHSRHTRHTRHTRYTRYTRYTTAVEREAGYP